MNQVASLHHALGKACNVMRREGKPLRFVVARQKLVLPAAHPLYSSLRSGDRVLVLYTVCAVQPRVAKGKNPSKQKPPACAVTQVIVDPPGELVRDILSGRGQ